MAVSNGVGKLCSYFKNGSLENVTTLAQEDQYSFSSERKEISYGYDGAYYYQEEILNNLYCFKLFSTSEVYGEVFIYAFIDLKTMSSPNIGIEIGEPIARSEDYLFLYGTETNQTYEDQNFDNPYEYYKYRLNNKNPYVYVKDNNEEIKKVALQQHAFYKDAFVIGNQLILHGENWEITGDFDEDKYPNIFINSFIQSIDMNTLELRDVFTTSQNERILAYKPNIVYYYKNGALYKENTGSNNEPELFFEFPEDEEIKELTFQVCGDYLYIFDQELEMTRLLLD